MLTKTKGQTFMNTFFSITTILAAIFAVGAIKKKTSQGKRKKMIKMSSMNKSKKLSWKAYRGQG